MTNSKALIATHLLALTCSASAQSTDQEASRRHIAAIYLDCLNKEGDRALSKAPDIRPRQFERIASATCAKIENGFRQMLQVDMMFAQLDAKRPLNAEERKVFERTTEQVITNLRRSTVVTYAQKFDEMHPGLRGCNVNETPPIDDPRSYFCAIHD